MSDAIDPLRLDLIQTYGKKAAEQAYRLLRQGHTPDSFIGIIADVNDSRWLPLTSVLFPDIDRAVQDDDHLRIALVMVSQHVAENIATAMPRFKDELTGPLPSGLIRVLVLANQGISIFLLTPTTAANMPS